MKEAIFGCILIFVLLALIPVPFGHPRESYEISFANRNAKELYVALSEFEAIYGHFPNSDIPADLQPKYSKQNRSDSNYLLGQVIALGFVSREDLFTIKHSKSCDNDISTPEKILESGECQFSYISKAGEIPYSTSFGSSALPILMFPMISGTEKFDPNFFDNQRVRGFYLNLDGSTGSMKINEEGQGLLKGQEETTILTTGEDTIWGEDKPLVHHPLPYEGAPSANSKKRPTPFFTKESAPPLVGFSLVIFFIAYYLFLRFKKQPIPQA